MSWETLANVPVDSLFSGFSNAVMINDKEFIISPEYFEHNTFFKYNIISNKWVPFIKYHNDMALSAHQISLDKKNQVLYIFGQGTELHKVNLITKVVTTARNVFNTGGNIATALANSEFHVIGGWNSNNHLIWNENKLAFESLHIFTEWIKGAQCCGLTYIPTQQLFLLFGGFDKGGEQYFDTIWIYSLKTKQWQTSNALLPHKMYDFGHVLTNNEKNIILFGGSGIKYRDQVWIFDIESMKFTMSQISCPKSSFGCRAIITPDNYVHVLYSNESREHWRINVKDIIPWYPIPLKTLVFGYVRLISDELQPKGCVVFPDALVRIIFAYY